jgi:tetratricopeptide (TPR) repeat protein
VIELLLQAERALAVGLVDQAERLYRQASEADPRNSIAVVGLARVALERGDDAAAYRLARRALEIDPENVAATRLAGRLEEVYAHRGVPLPEAAPSPEPSDGPAPSPAPPVEPGGAASPPAPSSPAASSTAPSPAATSSHARSPEPGPRAAEPPGGRGLLDRLLRRDRP